MGRIEILYKKRGETPLEALERIETDEKKSYAGRLDPIAEGLLLVLIGDENKNREKYLGLDKEYVIDVCWGIGTDTGDILGVITKKGDKKRNDFTPFVGKCIQQYPVYASKTVKGKPLWMYTREGKLTDIDIPTHDIEIYSIEIEDEWEEDIFDDVIKTVKSVKGDFRQDEIISSWAKMERCTVQLTRLRIRCSSGTYIRQLVKDFGIPACVYRLKRTRVGEYTIT